MDNYKILSIIVSYYPTRETLLPLITELRNQTTEIMVIDNTPAENDIVWEILKDQLDFDHLNVVRLGKNFGIATAINIGIDVAQHEGFSHVLLSDQDSLPLPEMVAGLIKAEMISLSSGKRVGAVGPVFVDTVTDTYFPFQVQQKKHLFYSNKHANKENPDVEALFIISSGSLISTEVFRQVGKMREDFFIDYVDIEWCHRAISKDYVLLGTHRGLMQHRMGEDKLRLWVFGWRYMNGYNPSRIYYRSRNYIYLLRLTHVPLLWKIRTFWYWLGVFYAYALFSNNRKRYFKAFLTGIWDGLLGRMGMHQYEL